MCLVFLSVWARLMTLILIPYTGIPLNNYFYTVLKLVFLIIKKLNKKNHSGIPFHLTSARLGSGSVALAQ